MTETTQVAVQKVDAPTEWGSREEIYALGKRIQAILPGSLTVEQSLLLAQYGHVMDANAARGEIYAYEHRGKLILVEGYKLLVRWARRQCQFYERYERITNDTDTVPEDAIAFRCRILRQDAVGDLATLTQAGVPNAYELCSTEAVGIVTKADRTKRNGQPQDPPASWTWEQVARKNALKNALRIAYGAPSPRELAAESWMIDDIETLPSDWEDVTPEMSIAEREATAKYNAQRRLSPPLEESAVESIDLLFSSATEDAPLSEKPPEPETAKSGSDITRPASAEIVKGWLTTKAGTKKHNGPPSPKQLGLMNGLLAKILGGDKERRSWINYTWNVTSSKDMTGTQVSVTLAWFNLVKDAETNEYIPHPYAISECKMMLRQAMTDKGQLDLFGQ